MSNKPIFVKGYFLGNLGDDLFLKVLSERYPDRNFVISTSKEYVSLYSPLSNVKVHIESLCYRAMRKLIRIAHLEKILSVKYDAFVEIGGSMFQQSLRNEPLDAIRNMWMHSGIPYFTIGSNFGPFLDDNYIKLYQKFFSRTSGVVFRDSYSFNIFSNLSNVRMAPDVVFGLQVKSTIKRRKVVICPIDLTLPQRVNAKNISEYRKGYERKIAEWIEFFVINDYEVDLMSFCDYEGDDVAIDRVLKDLDNDMLNSVNVYKNKDFNEKTVMFSEAEYVIGSRFHSMILGWLTHAKLLVVPYSSKTTEVIDDIFPEQKYKPITQFVNDMEPPSLNDFSVLPQSILNEVVSNSAVQFSYLDSFLKRKN